MKHTRWCGANRMKILFAAAALGTVLTVPGAQADDEQDETFWLTIQMQHIAVTRDKALAWAAAVCSVSAEPGQTFDTVALGLAQDNPGWTLDDAGYFAGAATAAYCPEYGPRKGAR